MKTLNSDELHVMSLNLRFMEDPPPHTWEERRPVVRRLLRKERPHLIGTQEGLFTRLRDVQADLPRHYDCIGQGREGGSHGEHVQVFFDTRRLDVREYNHYWLSGTPNVVGSQTWPGCPRMVTWIRFLDRRTGAEFYAINTHLEAFDSSARRKAARLLLRRLEQEFDRGLPAVITGDFNVAAQAGKAVFDLLVTNGPFLDTWAEAKERSRLYATMHRYQPPVPDGRRIDWILTSPDVTTRAATVNTFQHRGRFPSDHHAVQAVLQLPTPAVTADRS